MKRRTTRLASQIERDREEAARINEARADNETRTESRKRRVGCDGKDSINTRSLRKH